MKNPLAGLMQQAQKMQENLKQEKMAGLTGGFDLPPGFKLPF